MSPSFRLIFNRFMLCLSHNLSALWRPLIQIENCASLLEVTQHKFLMDFDLQCWRLRDPTTNYSSINSSSAVTPNWFKCHRLTRELLQFQFLKCQENKLKLSRMKCLEIVNSERLSPNIFSWIFLTLLSRERKSQKSCNFQPPSIILSHHNEREGNSSYCLYNRCQRAGKRKSAEKFHKTILNLCLLSLFNKLNLVDELFFGS